MIKLKEPRDLLLACIFAGFSAVAFIQGQGLAMGSARAMGPGYFPFVLACVLLAIAAALAIRSIVAKPLGEWPTVSIRVASSIIGAALLFGLLLRPVGLVVAILVAVLVSGFAIDGFRWKSSLLTGAVLAGGSALLFVYLLGQPIPLVGELF